MWPKFTIDLVGSLLALDCIWWMISGWRIRRFLRSTPQLETEEDLARFKDLVFQCSCCNILWAITLFLALGVFAIAVFSGLARPDEFERVLLIGILRMGIQSYFAIDLEERLKELPAATEGLRAEYEAIVRKWSGKQTNRTS